MNLRTHTNDAAVIKVAQQIFVDVRDVAGNLFRAELCISGFHLILFDTDGGINVVAYDFLV